MHIRKLASTLALSGVLSLAGAGIAMADSVSLNDTGPDSSNTATITNNSTQAVANTNNVTVTNTSKQTATTGSATVSENTNGGDATSGNASNDNTVSTTVNIDNSGTGGLGGGTGGSGGGTGGQGGSSTGGLGGGSGSSGAGGLGGGSGSGGAGGLGAGTAILPVTGCSTVCNVSDLRNAYHPTPKTALQQARTTSAGLLALAALLSLVGAGGSAWYATKRAKA